jgi:hypothetical protein
MSLLSFNMAVPVKDNRESQIYFLSSSENVPPTSQSVDRKIFSVQSAATGEL